VGNTAYVLNKQLVTGKELKIEYDVETKDPRGRDLAWVWVGETLVNAEIVKGGEAWVSIFPPNVKYMHVLYKAQDEAAKAKKGIWTESAK
jgi:endonuclease YncB( thermonuclease family)